MVGVKKFEVLRFTVSGFDLNSFIKEQYMPLVYIKLCFEHTLGNRQRPQEFCLWQNNFTNALEIFFWIGYIEKKGENQEWWFSETELDSFCKKVALEINKVAQYKVTVSVSPENVPFFFLQDGEKFLPNTPVQKKKVYESFKVAKNPGFGRSASGKQVLIQSKSAINGTFSFFYFNKRFESNFSKFRIS